MNDKYPRTLEEAFGPYTSREIHPIPEAKPSGYSRGWWMAIYCVALAALVVITTTGPA